jgi:hypothetical protein
MALRLGTKNSTLRERALELFKDLWAAIGATGPSDYEFLNFNKPTAQVTRLTTKVALQTFAGQHSIDLENPWDPLADYDTAYTNLGKVTGEAPENAHIQDLAETYWETPPAADIASLYAGPPPPPVESRPVTGWLLLGSAGLLVWWFTRQ